jgi:hypothetical protein
MTDVPLQLSAPPVTVNALVAPADAQKGKTVKRTGSTIGIGIGTEGREGGEAELRRGGGACLPIGSGTIGRGPLPSTMPKKKLMIGHKLPRMIVTDSAYCAIFFLMLPFVQNVTCPLMLLTVLVLSIVPKYVPKYVP